MRGGPRVLGIVLAGGEGKRLAPLTQDRAKPAVPFGGNYRLIDFVLSNLVNAEIRQIAVLTQYKSHSLDRHITQTWRMSQLLGNYVTPVPAQQRLGPRWYTGSADAIFQSLNLIYDERPEVVVVFGADHVYRMDPRQMLAAHIASGAGLTVAGVRVPLVEASSFGIIETGDDHRIRAFREKPRETVGLPDAPDQVLASMGNYIFTARTLIDAVTTDAEDDGSRHDLGGSLVPMLVEHGEAAWYDFTTNSVPGSVEADRGYWRDVGEIDSYYDSHMDLIAPMPVFNLYNADWPIFTWHRALPPAKFVVDERQPGQALDSLVSAGVIVAGGTVRRSVLSPGVRVEAGALVEGSVVMDDACIGRGAFVRNAILDKNVVVADGARIGHDPDADRARFTVSSNGVTVVGKNHIVRAQ